MDKKKYMDVLTKHAEVKNHPYESALNDFLDFLIEVFDVKAFYGKAGHYAQHFQKHFQAEPEFMQLALLWLSDVADAMESGRWLDAFGELYEEMYLTRGKASKTGQFFTPRSVSDFCSEVLNTDNKKCGLVNDCAAGSGRLLLSHFMNEFSKKDASAARFFRYVAQDSDPIACKMCALNLMAHGMNAEVICQDTLLMSTPAIVYSINEVRYPFISPYYSIRAKLPKTADDKQ